MISPSKFLVVDCGSNRINNIVNRNDLGCIIAAQAKFGQYLPDWRPAQDYGQGLITHSAIGCKIVLVDFRELGYVR